MKECLRAQEAAEILNLSPWTLYRLAREGRVPHVRIGGRVLFRRSSLIAWLDRQEAESVRQSGA
ncbi:MAG: helix-turn-helix domain-containing protein [Bacillota bacterium]